MRLLVFAWTVLIVASGGPAAAQVLPGLVSGLGDRLVLAGPTSLFEGPLPRGPVTASAALPEWLDALAYAPDGRLLAVQLSATDVPAIRLFEVGEEGGLNLLGTIDPFIHEVPLDLAFDRSGRLYYLSSYTWWNPPEVITILRELDASSGAVRREAPLEREVYALAPAPDGLWAIGDRLYHLNPATGALTGAGGALPWVPLNADADASGALWVLALSSIVSPPLLEVYRLDPATGSQRRTPFDLPPQTTALAVRRQCASTGTARCLQGGRFRAEVDWRDFEGHSGPGRSAAARSADSALFWFFDPANWEVMLKVLDFCDFNGHFGLFATGMTNVAYTLRITDLETGEVRSIDNPLGELAATVADTTAFTGCP